MQKEIRRRVQVYAIAAILIAVILGSVCYNLGFIPEVPLPPLQSSFLKTFSSDAELKSFLTSNSKSQSGYTPYYGPLDSIRVWLPSVPSGANGFFFGATQSRSDDVKYGMSVPAPESTSGHSTTNIQVAGVDEADIVKNDGAYIYVVSGNTVFIMKAAQEDARIVSRIVCEDFTPAGIFVNGDRLAILGSNYSMSRVMPYFWTQVVESRTYASLYDVSDKAKPDFLKTFTMTGDYFNSRMIGKYVYFVTSQPAYVLYDTVTLPKVYSGEGVKEIPAPEIHYSNVSDDYFSFTTFVAMNMQDASEEPTHTSIMVGATSNMYVSLSNIYVTFREAYEETTIYRVHMQDNNLTCVAQGKVPGHELNQFSMDEYGDYFRIATTSWTGGMLNSTYEPYVQRSSLYVLDMNLSIVGRLQNIGVGENFHSARFMGDKCYLVTFQKTDPLFVINLTDPTAPTVLGELKIPGYSDYLHPYDENHLIGVGKETTEAEGGNFAWYQGIKISIFDVTNVSDPLQMSNVTIGDRGSDSPVLSDHKAFLFDRERDLLVIPVTVAKVDQSQYSYGGVPSWAYGTPVWQGAYVYNITLNGLLLRGTITHAGSTGLPTEKLFVSRALYIADVLYTISQGKIKLNRLVDMAFLKEVSLD
jgi:inhibitor of cysteine peptidase